MQSKYKYNTQLCSIPYTYLNEFPERSLRILHEAAQFLHNNLTLSPISWNKFVYQSYSSRKWYIQWVMNGYELKVIMVMMRKRGWRGIVVYETWKSLLSKTFSACISRIASWYGIGNFVDLSIFLRNYFIRRWNIIHPYFTIRYTYISCSYLRPVMLAHSRFSNPREISASWQPAKMSSGDAV